MTIINSEQNTWLQAVIFIPHSAKTVILVPPGNQPSLVTPKVYFAHKHLVIKFHLAGQV